MQMPLVNRRTGQSLWAVRKSEAAALAGTLPRQGTRAVRYAEQSTSYNSCVGPMDL